MSTTVENLALAMAQKAVQTAEEAKNDTEIQATKLWIKNTTTGALQRVTLEGSGNEVHFVFEV